MMSSGVDTWMRKIHAFLSANQTQAFMMGDMASRIRTTTTGGLRELSDADFEKALGQLVKTGSIKTRTVNGVKYYSYGSFLKL